jgi:phenylalanyl-tRNA synthetase alpha chain
MKMIDKIKGYIGETKLSQHRTNELEAFRIKFLGTKGFKEFFCRIKKILPNEQRKDLDSN